MRTGQEVEEKIKQIEKDYAHVLNIPPASTFVNAPRALMQVSAKSELDVLYWCLGEKRPILPCDDFTKLDY